MLEKDCAIHTIVDGDFTAKLLPEGYLSIRYKNYDCYGIMVDENLSEEKMKEVLGYVETVYTYRDEEDEITDSSKDTKKDNSMKNYDEPVDVNDEFYQRYGFVPKKKKMDLKIQDKDFSEVPNDLSFNYVWGTLNRVDKNILKNKVLAHLENQKLKEEFDRIELMVKFEIPYDVIKAVYYDIDEKELQILYKRLTRTK
ncbi:MAG: hypothetical protein IJ763_06910 [Lachnospiraceae bacterium]|nr:hypothetical protein [Lachnospiraceae bacterium]